MVRTKNLRRPFVTWFKKFLPHLLAAKDTAPAAADRRRLAHSATHGRAWIGIRGTTAPRNLYKLLNFASTPFPALAQPHPRLRLHGGRGAVDPRCDARSGGCRCAQVSYPIWSQQPVRRNMPDLAGTDSWRVYLTTLSPLLPTPHPKVEASIVAQSEFILSTCHLI